MSLTSRPAPADAQEPSPEAGGAAGRRPGLTDRQLDVLELALRGLTHQQIGDRLFLSLDTVKTHFRRIYAQLVDDRGRPATGAMHAVSLALKQGWLLYDPVGRQLVRPVGVRPLPAYAEANEGSTKTAGTARSVQQRRADLGW